jgi:hypothetical protein
MIACAARRRLRSQRRAPAAGKLSLAQFRRSLSSWISHEQHDNPYQLRSLRLTQVTWSVNRPAGRNHYTVGARQAG